jgi:catechol 2,3-dioxygenase-like lactoylglutathione lyase family enzyme
MDRIAHLALAAPDVVKTADFYKEVFGLAETERKYEPTAGDNPPDEMVSRLYLSDGYMNVTLCKASRLSNVGHIEGLYHFGFEVDDLDKTWERLQATSVTTLTPRHPQSAGSHHELKIRGPQDVIIDLAEPGSGWLRGHTMEEARCRIQHLALGTPDVAGTANFYKEVFGLSEICRRYEPEAGDNPRDDMLGRIFLSDGYMNIAICKAVSGKVPSGLYHFGFKLENVDETLTRLEAVGASRITPRGRTTSKVLVSGETYEGNEVKYSGPEGVIMDLSPGWSH